MKIFSKIARIRFMMIAAQLLLTGFAVHWVNMQFKEREQLVLKDIGLAWVASQQQMIDSMLLKQYIEPAIDSTAKYAFRFEFNTDSIHSVSQGKEATKPAPYHKSQLTMPSGSSQIIVNITDSVDNQNFDKKGGQPYITRDLVLQGVKLFVNRQTDTEGKKPDLSAAWIMNPDTSLLRSTFNNRLKAIDPNIRITWVADSTTDSTGNRRTIRYSMLAGENNIEAGVEGYRMLILRSIWPQLAFALLLVLLTATSFITSFRSLKNMVLLNEQRNDFIRNMSHELKTPVATVKVALEALKNFNRRNDPAIMDEYLEMATSETNRLEMLINRVMNISAGNGDTIQPNLEPVEIKSLIGEVLLAFKPRLEAEDAKVILMLPEENLILNIDRLHMQGVFFNLIDNSLKYSIPPALIEIELSKENSVVKVSVSDQGIGIPVEFRNRIFEKFFRVPTGDLHNVKGYGLGLSYAKMVMKQHNGSISYRERNGGGSTFQLLIPING
ncbi:MAG: HAMP domain-containing histidine kinase [Lentimicrobium sp.]|nr:HAMP domain-containing histidine kinase [Lentimicrobium sp.]